MDLPEEERGAGALRRQAIAEPLEAEHSGDGEQVGEWGEITQWLAAWRSGDGQAQQRLFAAIYPELRRIASNRLRAQADCHTLHPTELIHEAWIRLAQAQNMTFEHRAKFYGAAATIMRHVLVDRARARRSLKRDGGAAFVAEVAEAQRGAAEAVSGTTLDYEGISQALERLEQVCPRQAKQVELRFFGGFSAQETADILEISLATLKRDWLAARMFIKDYLQTNP